MYQGTKDTLGHGTVYFDKNRGLYVADFRWTQGSEHKRKVFRDKKKSVVTSKMNEFRRELQNKKNLDIQNNVLFSEYATCWLNDFEANSLKPTSFIRKEQTLRCQVFPYIGDITMGDLSLFDVQGMINKLSETLSYSTVKKAYDAVNACYKHFRIATHSSNDPCLGVKIPISSKKATSDIKFFTEDQLRMIEKEAVSNYPTGNPRYRLGNAYIVLAFTGMRIGELIALTWKDVDFDNNLISINKNAVEIPDKDQNGKYVMLVQDSPKTDSSNRVIPLNMKAATALHQLQKIAGNSDLVVSKRNGELKSPYHMNKTFHSILRRCGIEPNETKTSYGVHALRHTFATMMFRNGCPVKIVSQILGHSNTKITEDIYIHIIQEQEAKAINTLDSYLD